MYNLEIDIMQTFEGVTLRNNHYHRKKYTQNVLE